MIKMCFDKNVVLETLRKNLKEHREIFKEAVVGYRAEAEEQLDQAIARLEREEGPVKVYVVLQAPKNHEADYEAVIHMLETSLDSEVNFDDGQYRCYMLDEWDWQRRFLTSNSMYSESSTAKALRMGMQDE